MKEEKKSKMHVLMLFLSQKQIVELRRTEGFFYYHALAHQIFIANIVEILQQLDRY